jgi:hypothetical protein
MSLFHHHVLGQISRPVHGAATLSFQLQRHFLFATARSRVDLKNPCSSVFICG